VRDTFKQFFINEGFSCESLYYYRLHNSYYTKYLQLTIFIAIETLYNVYDLWKWPIFTIIWNYLNN